jgi:hypothetical protein
MQEASFDFQFGQTTTHCLRQAAARLQIDVVFVKRLRSFRSECSAPISWVNIVLDLGYADFGEYRERPCRVFELLGLGHSF